ncbi:MAG TPA: protease pro-enzyme activation domain-containing protein [Candidatus Sulfotelmatobacter sp.]
MSKSRVLVCLLLAVMAVSGIGYAAIADRIASDLANGPKVALRGNVHGFARPEFDLGRADASRPLQGVSLAFRPSPAQQKDLDRFLAELANPKSPNFHKYLSPAQFGERFGLSLNDIAKITNWLQSQGFTNISVANGRNQISFDGNVGQIESVFSLEMHNYAVDGVVHLANAGEPAIPAALAGMVIGLGSLHDFAPKPRAKIQSHLTSYVSGNHFLTPADFATIYNINPLYSAGADGTGQKIAVVGQSTVSTTDLNNFRSAAGLPASTVTMTLQGGTAAKCPGDEGESDLDIEWSGGVAKKAQIIFIFAGLVSPDKCQSRTNNVWNALQYAVDHKVAPFISTSYGFCESGVGSGFASQVQVWAQQAITQGQTIVAASGDAGAADCESISSTSATKGLGVDVPASIPEVTGAGGNEFSGDMPPCTAGCPPGSDPPYWSAAGATTDTVSSALQYIPEMAWNDTSASISGGGGLSASGGGASKFFAKPSWQTGIGVPADSKRDVPDISVSASNFQDPYLVCSEDGDTTPCASGFRDSVGGNFFAVGGTSASAPTFSAILALVNQYIGHTGMAPVNPTLYSLAASNPSVFHDVTTGDNKVPCTAPSTDCPSGTTEIGFSAGTGYDQVTGLGSVDAFAMAQALSLFSLSAAPLTPASVSAGTTTTTTITVTPNNGFTGTVSFSCSGLPSGASCVFNPTSVLNGSGTTTLTIQTAANSTSGTTSVTVKGSSGTSAGVTIVSLVMTATTEGFSLVANPAVGTLSVARGQTTSPVNLTVTSTSTPTFVLTNGSGSTTALPLTYSCSGLPSEATCKFGSGAGQTITTSSTAVSFQVVTTAPTARLQRSMDRSRGVFYAVLLPGLFGIVFLFDCRTRSHGSLRILAMLVMLSLSTLWMASCGGTSSNKDPGTPTGSFPFTVNATTGGGAPLTSTVKFTLSVTP